MCRAHPFGMRTMKAGMAMLGVTLCVACGSSSGPNDSAESDVVAPAGQATATPPAEGAFGEAQKSTDGTCSEAAKDIYVLSNNFDLYRFNPGALTFKRVGQFDCIGPKNPNFYQADAGYTFRGMAIDRAGHGWLSMIRYVDSVTAAAAQPTATAVDQALVEFNTNDASCKVHDYERVMSFAEFSECGVVALGSFGQLTGKCEEINSRIVGNLTYSSLEATQESLYGTKDRKLITIDPVANQRSPIGILSEVKKRWPGGLTGTGDGRLYELFAVPKEDNGLFKRDYSFSVSQRDRATAGVLDTTAMDFASIKMWPSTMTFWGGDLWYFGIPRTDDGGAVKDQISVAQYNSTTKELKTVISNLSDAIGPSEKSDWSVLLGAANTTCAPLTSPK